MDAFEILVIVLSSILAVCLVLAVISGILVILILNQVKKVAQKASEVADNVEAASEFFKNTTTIGAILKILSNASDFITRKKRKD